MRRDEQIVLLISSQIVGVQVVPIMSEIKIGRLMLIKF
jgi:hypothetical protein